MDSVYKPKHLNGHKVCYSPIIKKLDQKLPILLWQANQEKVETVWGLSFNHIAQHQVSIAYYNKFSLTLGIKPLAFIELNVYLGML